MEMILIEEKDLASTKPFGKAANSVVALWWIWPLDDKATKPDEDKDENKTQ